MKLERGSPLGPIIGLAFCLMFWALVWAFISALV